MDTIVDSTVVVVPSTVRLPPIVVLPVTFKLAVISTSPPVTSIPLVNVTSAVVTLSFVVTFAVPILAMGEVIWSVTLTPPAFTCISFTSETKNLMVLFTVCGVEALSVSAVIYVS